MQKPSALSFVHIIFAWSIVPQKTIALGFICSDQVFLGSPLKVTLVLPSDKAAPISLFPTLAFTAVIYVSRGAPVELESVTTLFIASLISTSTAERDFGSTVKMAYSVPLILSLTSFELQPCSTSLILTVRPELLIHASLFWKVVPPNVGWLV